MAGACTLVIGPEVDLVTEEVPNCRKTHSDLLAVGNRPPVCLVCGIYTVSISLPRQKKAQETTLPKYTGKHESLGANMQTWQTNLHKVAIIIL